MSFLKKTPIHYPGSEVLTVVGPEAVLHGTITVRGSVRVEGQMEGDITEAQEVVVGSSGSIRGNVCAERAEIGGQVHGDVVCSAHLALKSGSRVRGNVRAPRLVVEDGALFDGGCVMTESTVSEPVS